ncbi:MAG: serine protease [Patescibacteria group bacterium]
MVEKKFKGIKFLFLFIIAIFCLSCGGHTNTGRTSVVANMDKILKQAGYLNSAKADLDDIADPILLNNAKASVLIGVSTGSGVVINHRKGLIITCYHVVDGLSKNELNIIFRRGDKIFIYRARILRANGENDLALLQIVDQREFRRSGLDGSVRLGERSQIKIGEMAYNLGYPHAFSSRGFGLSYNVAHISRTDFRNYRYMDALNISKNQPSRVLLDLHPLGGVSGSGVYAEDGRLIGLVQGRTDGPFGIVIPIDQIRRFLMGIDFFE